MQLTFINIFGPVLVIVAFWMFGRQMVARTSGRNFRPLAALVLMVFAIAAHFIWGTGTLLDQFTLMLMNFGIGMIIDAGYLAYKKHHPKIFWVPGVLALILSSGIYLFSALLDTIVDSIRNRPDTVELLVELGPDDSIDELKPILKKYKADCNSKYDKAFENVDLSEDEDLAQYYIIYVDSAVIDALMVELKADVENVDHVARNREFKLIEPPAPKQARSTQQEFIANDPYIQNQWFAATLNYNQVHNLLRGKKPQKKARVAILDTGVDQKHEDVKSIFVKKSKAKRDLHGHGTHCAGLAGAITNNKTGIASMNWEGKFVEIASYSALDRRGRGTHKRIAQAIIDAAEADADVISMSLGGPSLRAPKVITDAVEYAKSLGAIVVVAAGNSAQDAKHYSPANVPGVIVVSAIDEQLNKAGFSNTNTNLNMPIAAPGVNILSLQPKNEYASFNGTSMATPIVAGLVGIMKSLDQNITTEQAYKILKQTGKEIKDTDKAGKLIQPYEALSAMEN